MKITITSLNVDEKKWIKGERSGVIRTQDAQAECARFRQRIRLDLGKDEPFPLGEYSCDIEDAISVGDFGDLKLARRLPLVSIGAPAPKR
ncbi:MAG: hypothetical protein KUL77_12080 [Thermomonas sp.]|uniref:hypothetical protein n=1 Tax=Thermomonas sp. TaxID=1971895 RepID=UPI001EB1CE1B|nr:hypothetical protein [Thermomonas sp.]MBV2210286.1 hypothetical protein [Thermomonas sp.]